MLAPSQSQLRRDFEKRPNIIHTRLKPQYQSAYLVFLFSISLFIECSVHSVIAQGAVEPPAGASVGHPPLSLVFLLDSSGSMRQNDPQGLRKAAAQAVVSLLSPGDEVAVVEYDDSGRVLSAEREKSWYGADRREKLSEIIGKIGDRGGFTDFRAGLLTAIPLFDGIPDSRRKVILLLTDGILDPNPKDPAYAPYHMAYPIDMAKAGKNRRKEVAEEYRERLGPVARRMMSSDVLPALRAKGIEIFSVALGPKADRPFLGNLSIETSRNALEQHDFYAEKATDLIETFTRLLQYWTDMTILRSSQGEIRAGETQSINLDEFIRTPSVLALVDGSGDFMVQRAAGVLEEAIPFTHSSLRGYNIRGPIPGTWSYGFRGGTGKYRIVWVGLNALRMDVGGLKGRYDYGETVEAQVYLRLPDGKSALGLLSPETRVSAELAMQESGIDPQRVELIWGEGFYRMLFSPERSGPYTVRFTANARDRQGKEILPRPSTFYRFEVMPRLAVTPALLDFGKAKGGEQVSRSVDVRSGLTGRVDLTTTGRVTRSSRKRMAGREMDRLPAIRGTRFSVVPGETRKELVMLVLPKNVEWGDYEGEIDFRATSGETSVLRFRVHVPSLWERVRFPVLLLLLLLILGIAYLIYVLGLLPMPFGSLVPVAYPQGELPLTIKLSQVKRGFLARYLNWRRNVVRLSELSLKGLPPRCRGELIFRRQGMSSKRVLLVNRSPVGSDITFIVEEPEMGVFRRGPGQSLSLKHESTIEIGEYKFRYEKR